MCVFNNTMNNSVQLKDEELRLLVFLLIIQEMRSSAALESATWVCFLGENSFKICKTVRNEEATVRL